MSSWQDSAEAVREAVRGEVPNGDSLVTRLLSNIPHSLKTRKAWVGWRRELRQGKLTKVPVVPLTGEHAKTNDASTWTDFETAVAHASRYDGIGIMFADGLCGVDLDGCRDCETGAVEPWAQEIVRELSSYTEVSPSGTGLHILLLAELPRGGRRKGQIEIYGPDSPRYFTVTGERLDDTPIAVEPRHEQLAQLHRRVFGAQAGNSEAPAPKATLPVTLTDDEILAKARAARNGPEFTRLWEGGYPDDDSQGDLSLCCHLAFWTAGEASRMDRLFRQSRRMRPKWDQSRSDETYGRRTIRKALELTAESYRPGNRPTPTPTAETSPAVHTVAPEVITTARLASAVCQRTSFAVDQGGALYVYEAGVYRPHGERHIRAEVKRTLAEWGRDEKWSKHRQEEVCEYIRVDAPPLWPVPPLELINCANGLLDVNGRKLLPHSPRHLSPVQIPVAYEPQATCPAWRHFIERTFPEDAPELAAEIVAWLMTPDTSHQKALLLLGEGANGKSTFLTGLIRFLGAENCANVSLNRLEDDRFAPAQLFGRLANICPDLPSAELVGTSVFKALTGGDLIYAERKYAQPFKFANHARLVFSANHPPRSADSSHAFYRRWVCVPFLNSFEGDAARPRAELDAELARPRELSGLLNLALGILPRVRTHGITESALMREALSDLRATTDPVAVWRTRETAMDPEAVTPKGELLAAYNEACRAEGRPLMGHAQFGKALKRVLPDLQDSQRNVGGSKTHVWLGIRLKGGGR